MEEKKVSVAILGSNGDLLKNVTNRVNDSRPAEVTYFLSLKDFLEYCLENQPDLIGISVSFPHKSAQKFPKIFKTALNLPVLVFGENQELKTRKALSSTTADLKISGVITAHNLWMKIVNYKKMIENESKGSLVSSDGNNSSNEVKSNTTHLKGGDYGLNSQNKSSLLSNLFAALDNPDAAEKSPNMQMFDSSGDGPKQTNMNMVQSTDATKYKKKSNVSHVSNTESASSESGKGLNAAAKALDNLINNDNDNEGGAGTKNGEGTKGSNVITGNFSKNQNQSGNEKASLGKKSNDNSDSGDGPLSSTNDPQKSSTDGRSKQDQANAETSGGSVFGKVQLADEQQIRQDNQKKTKEQEEKEYIKKKNILLASCEIGLEVAYNSKASSIPEIFGTNKLVSYIIESGSFRGYIVLAESQTEKDEPLAIKFRKVVIENLKKNGMACEFSRPYWIDIDVDHYEDAVSQFADFNITHKGKNNLIQNVCFVAREAVKPSFQDSDKPDMYNVDIKVIPPQTPVNFDAFLYLPRNNRFVRYLKKGRSLSLKQAKRHSEEKEQSRLYLPRDHKDRFISFFIQNTLNWEFTLHKKKKSS